MSIISKKKIRLAIAGSTQYSQKIAETLVKDQDFDLVWVLTPPPKKIGRQQLLTINPLAQWAKEQKINIFLVPDNLKNLQLKNKLKNRRLICCWSLILAILSQIGF